MFARLVSGQTGIDKLDSVIQIWKKKDIPLMKPAKGYRGAFLFTDRKTGKAISMTLWDSEADAIADQRSTVHHKQENMYKDFNMEEFVYQLYEVSARDKI